MYEHSEVPEGIQPLYLKLLKRPFWEGDPSRVYNASKSHSASNLKRGALTWMNIVNYKENPEHILIEDNYYGWNFDPSCFRYVDEEGNTIKHEDIIKIPRYRFKTAAELIDSDDWDFSRNCPINWDDSSNNHLLGTAIPYEHNESLDKGVRLELEGIVFKTDREITRNHTPKDYLSHGTIEDLKERYESLPKYRFKSVREINSKFLWNEAVDMPIGWGEDKDIKKLLNKGIPTEFEDVCDKGESLVIGEVEISSDYYTEVSEDKITSKYLLNFETCELKEEYYRSSKISISEDREKESMEEMEEILNKVYDDAELRSSIVPLFIGNPGLGKTKIIEKFVEERGVKLVELITSQMSPFEISGIAMPDKDSKKMTYYNYDKIESLEDGDVLFFDELLNGNPVVLNACLTILEQRRLISGKSLPNVLIVAAANPQGMVPLTPQIKERFVWYPVKFSPNMWKDYMLAKYGLPNNITSKFCKIIEEEEFTNNNFNTPRSIDKAVNMVIKGCPTPYYSIVRPVLESLVHNNLTKRRYITETKYINPGESIKWIDLIQRKIEDEITEIDEGNSDS